MGSRFNVLVVEDDPAIVEVLIAMLESQYNVSSANTVEEALAFLRTSHVDVVLADKVLPDGRGSDVARLAEDVGAAVIEMSGYAQDQDGLERSERPYLDKPFGMEALLSTIGSAIHDHLELVCELAAGCRGTLPCSEGTKRYINGKSTVVRSLA